MHQQSAARALHEKALELWPPREPWDQRSLTFIAVAAQLVDPGVLAGSVATQQVTNWFDALARFENFWWQNGRAPREKTRNATSLPDAERRMGEWARRQRRFRQRLCDYQVLRLDVSPAFAWDPQQAAWQANYRAALQRLRTTGTLPYLNADSSEEFALARWLGRQIRQLQRGTLLPPRAEAINSLLSPEPIEALDPEC